MSVEEKILNAIRDVNDFPIKGIVFKDITPIMMNPVLSNEIIDDLYNKYKNEKIDKIAGIESRGFLLGYPLAMKLGLPFVLIRKKGKLPYKTIAIDYTLEYGSATIEIHEDAINQGDKVLLHDDLLATGGSADAAAQLIEKCGGKVEFFDFIVDLAFLCGQEKLKKHKAKVNSLVKYE